MISLYDDQQDLIDRVRDAMRHSKAILCQSATGSGKTIMAMHMIQAANAKGNSVGFMVPRRKLLDQTSKTLDGFGITHGFVASGRSHNPFAKTHMIMSGTLARRLDKAPALKILFDDEAHYGGAEKQRVIEHYKAQGTWIIGLTATPILPNGDGMGDVYDVMVKGPPAGWLIENKRLSKYRLFGPDKPDLSGIATRNGDYVKKEINGYMMADEHGKKLVGNAARHYKENAWGKLNLSFCTSVLASKMSSQMFNDAGIPSACLHGDMDDRDIQRIIMAFARREILNISSCMLIAFGFDLAQASGQNVTVESMSDLAPTKSLQWQKQKWGRPMRMKPDPAFIFDHVGNHLHHGMPHDEPDWTLDVKPKRGGNSEPTKPVRQCPSCYFVHRPSPTCLRPGCGFVYPIDSRMVEEVEGDLAEVMERQRKVDARQEQGRTETLADLLALAARTGKKPGWAQHVFAARQKKRASA
jgi:DNA repair protein RadD